jgi:uncharacterized FlaG/YvyC family protein
MEIKNYKTSSSYLKIAEAEAQIEAERAHSKTAARQADASKTNPDTLSSQKVYFAIDNNDNVIIKFVDNKTGKVVNQVPLEEYLKMSEELKKVSGKLFHKEV